MTNDRAGACGWWDRHAWRAGGHHAAVPHPTFIKLVPYRVGVDLLECAV
jgi:hypothetical protein